MIAVGRLLAGGLLAAIWAGSGAAQPASDAAGYEPPWSRPPAWAKTTQGTYFSDGYERAARAAASGDGASTAPPARRRAPPVEEASARPVPTFSATPSAGASPGADRQGQPLWEIGVIGGVGVSPDWPAASETSTRTIALPLIRYRGDVLRADEKGLLRARLVHRRDVELDVAVDGSLPAESDSDGRRAGMPDIDWLGEIGPRLQWTVARAAHSARIDLEIPLRAVFSTDFHSHLTHEGWILDPELSWRHANFLNSGTAVSLGLGPIFGDEGLNEVFYEVAPAYRTPSRPAYDADAGYMGSKAVLSAAHPLTDWVSVLGRLRADYHGGAANEDSPLFQDDMTYGATLALSITFAKSKRREGGGE